jgi:protein OS-9
MRNLHIYLSALATLSVPVIGLRHGSRQLRDMLAFPKYQVEFMNELPLSHSDAERCRAMGVEDEDEFTQVRFEGKRRRSISESDSESTGGENAADTEGPESGDSAAGGPRTRVGQAIWTQVSTYRSCRC